MSTLSSIPLAPRTLPLAGHIVPVLRDAPNFLSSLPAHGDLVRIRLGPITMVVITHPEITRQMLVDDRTFDKGGPIFDRIREVIGNGLASCPHSAHRQLRRLTQPAFHADRLRNYTQSMVTCIDHVAQTWQADQVLDVPREMAAITSRATALALFSSGLPIAQLARILNDVTVVFDAMFQRMLKFPPLDRLPTPGNRRFFRARSRLLRTIKNIIAERRADGVDHGDLLSALLMARDLDGNGRGLNDEEVTDTVFTFFLGGTETTAAALSWAFDLLGRHPEFARRCYAEVDNALDGSSATHADLPQLPLTEQIIKETLRLRPPAWFLTRTVTADLRLGRHFVPAGTTIAYSPYLIHHRPDFFEDPDRFDPDRWDPKHPRPPRHAFIPFGAGARKCIGDTFALTEATLALASISSRWRLQHARESATRPALGLSLRPLALPMYAIPQVTQFRPTTCRHV